MALGDFDLGEETLGNEQSSEGDGGLIIGIISVFVVTGCFGLYRRYRG
jgi:hypothetical protein